MVCSEGAGTMENQSKKDKRPKGGCGFKPGGRWGGRGTNQESDIGKGKGEDAGEKPAFNTLEEGAPETLLPGVRHQLAQINSCKN